MNIKEKRTRWENMVSIWKTNQVVAQSNNNWWRYRCQEASRPKKWQKAKIGPDPPTILRTRENMRISSSAWENIVSIRVIDQTRTHSDYSPWRHRCQGGPYAKARHPQGTTPPVEQEGKERYHRSEDCLSYLDSRIDWLSNWFSPRFNYLDAIGVKEGRTQLGDIT